MIASRNSSRRGYGRPVRRTTTLAVGMALCLVAMPALVQNNNGPLLASASAVSGPTMTSRSRRSGRNPRAVITKTAAAATATAETASPAVISETSTEVVDGAVAAAAASTEATTTKTSSNPITQLATYVKNSVVTFKDGLVQMNADHRRCNDIRTKQRVFALNNNTSRPRGVKGIQTGGISYEEYDFLRKGLVDRNKLFAVACVSVCLPNYFVYYLWSFPDMMPGPFLKEKDMKEISRERCHAVIATLLDIEKGARVAPWSSKLNPFGRKATERAMDRLGSFIDAGCAQMEEYGAAGSNGAKMVLQTLSSQIYSKDPLTKKELLLAGNVVPKQIMKGLTKAIGADPLNKGSSPFGIGAAKHIESVTLADEFLVDQSVDVDSINSQLLAEACSARLIGGPDWSDVERKEALGTWLQEAEIAPREATKDGEVHYNGNLARAALMCYNAVDGTRDGRSDSRLLRVMYQGQSGAVPSS